MKRAALAIALLVGVLVTLPARAESIAGSTFASGNWRGAAFEANGRFTHCGMSARYRSGISMFFSVSGDWTWRIAWQHDDWRLTVGQAVPVTFWIDSFQPRQVNAKATQASFAIAELPAEANMFDLFRRGYMLYVTAEGRRFQFSLDGTYAALTSLGMCVKQQRQIAGLDPAPTPPQLRGPAPHEPQPTPRPQADLPQPTMEQRLQAMTVVANMLAQSDMGGFRILSDSELRTLDNSFLNIGHIVWQGPRVLGMLRIIPRGAAASVDEVAANILAGDSRSCKGTFASGFTSDELGAAKRMFSACDSAVLRVLLRYTVVAADDGVFYIFLTTGRHGDLANRDTIDQAEATLRKAVYEVMRR
ncbi:hypothetical protein FHP25_05365 [Vineibacter terrae]|uniref:Uncharacterized protein n=1 Tax=Vineibacter terrae TaxID=2586908 RepID=A0A5C8PT91_9HYPH|nr:hypothetical protein [Vineibacter terrae]TXL80455.1 hypothetical protein FHP25_05365 [Vineibacter terrae]